MTNKNKKKLNIVSENVKSSDKMIVYKLNREKKVICQNGLSLGLLKTFVDF